jgi:hypothetical protein
MLVNERTYMLYGLDCECGNEIDSRRVALGYFTCLVCGEKEAKKRKFTIAPINKSNYMMITDRELLKQLNPKRTT